MKAARDRSPWNSMWKACFQPNNCLFISFHDTNTRKDRVRIHFIMNHVILNVIRYLTASSTKIYHNKGNSEVRHRY